MRRLTPLLLLGGALVATGGLSCSPPGSIGDPPPSARQPGTPPDSTRVPEVNPLPKPPTPVDELPTSEVANILQSSEPSRQFDEIVKLGAVMFPKFETILDSPAYHTRAKYMTFKALSKMECDTSPFHDRAVAALGDGDSGVRRCAVEFLAKSGGQAECGPLTVLLLDDSTETRYAAAKALAAIGGKREVATFDLILANAPRYMTAEGKPMLTEHNLKHLERCRDALKERLKKQDEKAKEKAEPKK